MEPAFVQFLAASSDRSPIHTIHRLEQGGVEFNRVVGFGKRELGYGRVELQLEALEENRMIDASFRALPTQDAVSEDEFDALRFAIDTAVERVKCLEDFHRRASGLFGFQPFLAQELPAFQARRPCRVLDKLRN